MYPVGVPGLDEREMYLKGVSDGSIDFKDIPEEHRDDEPFVLTILHKLKDFPYYGAAWNQTSFPT